jgi:hypothetical protein
VLTLTAQAIIIDNSIKGYSSLPFLAAIILLLPTASQAAQAAACNSETAQGDLLEHAKTTAASNRQQALLFSDEDVFAHPPEHTQGAAAGGHAPVGPISPTVQKVFDNGGISQTTLA